MVPILFRAFSTVATVIIAVAVSATIGESATGKVWAAILIAAVIAAVEWLLIWTPKHSAVARKLLDPRAKMVGIWVQNVDRVFHGQEDNRFSIFWLDHQDSGDYDINGFAYNPEGVEHARWWSDGIPEFGKDGRSMTYRWKGTVMENGGNDDSPDRTGVASMTDGGTGRVEHVGMNLDLEVSFERVTTKWLEGIGLGQYKPDDLKKKGIRDTVASAYARSLPPLAIRGVERGSQAGTAR